MVPQPDVLVRLQAALADRYTIERELGRGGMATVYLARDLKHDRPVALKVLSPELAAVLGPERFLREVKITARLNHPHILPLLDSGEADSFLFYVMPYVAGESLRDRLNREKQLPVDDALQIAREVADALSYAHSHDVVHRDIKPENILLESGHAVVADFGIARAISAAGGDRLTETGLAVGTVAYMSPEQAAGSQDLDGRSDLYSLGCVLFEMLAGQTPFTAPTVEAVVRQHLTAEAPGITALRPAVPGWVAAAVARALAKTPADRFSPVALFAEALTRHESAATPAAVPAPVVAAPVAPPARRLRPALVGAAGVVVVVGALLALRVGRQPRAPATAAPARTAIAVLPFQNLSADGPHAYFAGGLHDELLTQLSKVAALSLRGRTSVMGYAGTTKSIPQIAEELQVGVLVEGSVQVVGERLRVNVQLIDAATDEHLWAESYDRTLDDAFAIQSDVAQRVVAAVGAALGAAERRGVAQAPTSDPEAYRLYLQGREYQMRPGSVRQNWEIAQQLYERAIARDPEFALARAALSEVHGRMHWFRYDPSAERVAAQREEAEAALRLAPDLPQAHLAMGLWHYFGRRDYRRALEVLAVAREGLPNDARVVELIGYVHRRLGNWDDVLAAFEKATELNPRDADLFFELGGGAFWTMRRYAEAVRAYDRALDLAPNLHSAAVRRGWTFAMWQGRLDTLRVVLSRLPNDQELDAFGSALAQRAQLLYWERHGDSLLLLVTNASLAAFDAQNFLFPPALYAGWAHELRGDGAAARAAFNAALVVLDSVMQALPDDWRVHAARGLALASLGRRDEAVRLDPLWDPIREHPRFRALLAKHEAR
jgi:serine/threonine-protein kinase